MLSTRVLSALILLPIVGAMVYLGGSWFTGFLAIVAVLASIEFQRIAERLGARSPLLIGAGLAAGLIIAAHYPQRQLGPVLFIFVLGALMVWRVLRQDYGGFLLDWGTTLVTGAYVGGMLSHYVLLRNLPQGAGWVALALITTWFADTAAYFVGRAWGRHPFFAKVSPHKTLEGALAGFAAGTLFAAGVSIRLFHVPWAQAVGLGLVLSLATILGDLSESLVKRQASIKDSGNLIPGHGGALDRIDSLLFAGVTVYYYVTWFIGTS